MEIFDWANCEKVRNPWVYKYLYENHGRKLSEEKYVEDMKSIQRVAHSKEIDKRNYKKRHNRWSRSSVRMEYRRLQGKFGFFTGV